MHANLLKSAKADEVADRCFLHPKQLIPKLTEYSLAGSLPV